MKTKRWLVILISILLLSTLISLEALAVETTPNYSFIPNSGEASVSKVNLTNGVVVAKYYTAPRLNDSINFDGTTDSAVPNTVPPYAWRTSRIATDADGNAWILNVGADAFLTDYPNATPSFSGYEVYNTTTINADGLVGSLVRIQADTTDLSTNTDHNVPFVFGTDEAVQVFSIGDKGDMPRAIAIDADGNIWIGFYGTGDFQKYSYNNGTLTPVGEPIKTSGSPYEAKIDKNGILYFSSRKANPTISIRTVTEGVGYFDTKIATPTITYVALSTPYSLLIDNKAEVPIVYATNYGNKLYTIQGNTATPIATINGASILRGMSFDLNGVIWMANTSDNTVCWYNPITMTSGESSVILAGATPVGVGVDAAGYMWAICRYDGHPAGFISKFDPSNLGAGFTNTFVGYRPYAYGDFAIPEQSYSICGYKFRYGTQEGLAGWTINLKDATGAIVATTTTDDNGKYCFDNLAAGSYKVEEVIDDPDHWIQRSPASVYDITLPSGSSDCEAALGDEGAVFYNFENEELYDICGYKFRAGTTDGLEGWTINLYKWDADLENWSNDVFMTTVTNEDGKYCFEGLTAGRYKVKEVIDDAIHWRVITPSSGEYSLSLPVGASDCDAALGDIGAVFYNFANEELYDICGYKLDADTNAGLQGWTINLYAWDSVAEDWSTTVLDTETTDTDGHYCFTGLAVGRYKVTETTGDPDLWLQTYPTSNQHLISLPSGASNCDTTLGAADPHCYNFKNAKLYELCGYKYGVNLLDGLQSTNKPLAGWTITLKDAAGAVVATTTTGADGSYCLTGLRAGSYTLSESFGSLNADGFWKTPDGKYWKPLNGPIAVNLPTDASDCDTGANLHNFFNQCYNKETAWAYGGIRHTEITGLTSNNWGWTIPLGVVDATQDYMLRDNVPIFAGAGQNVLTKGYLVGYVDIYIEGGEIKYTVTNVDGAVLAGLNVYIGHTEGWYFKGKLTNAPGQMKTNTLDFSKPVYMAMHWDSYVSCGFAQYEFQNEYTLNIASVNNYTGYTHIYTITYDPNDNSIVGLGSGSAGAETLSDFHFNKVGSIITYIDFKATYNEGGYVWFPAFDLNPDYTLTFVDISDSDNVISATGTWLIN